MGISVEALDVPVRAGVADELVALQRSIDAIRDPDDPPVPAEVLIPELEVERPEQRTGTWLARDGGELVGYLSGGIRIEGENKGYAEFGVEVPSDRRDHGVEHALVAAALPWMRDQGATSLCWWAEDGADRKAAESMGLTFRQQERCSRMPVAEVDQIQQEEWIAAPRARAAGYRVVSWQGPCPDELLDAYVVAFSAMADAPVDDLDWVPLQGTPARARRHERWIAEVGQTIFSSLALDADGAAAGMTALCVHPARPWFGMQEDTAVVRAHRGHALGRWLKAANLAQVVDAVPELGVVQTYNAETNPWMLAINVDMGFRPYRAFYCHQADIGDVVV
jgi:mycothiol synthase